MGRQREIAGEAYQREREQQEADYSVAENYWRAGGYDFG